jgi:hypothetical protein
MLVKHLIVTAAVAAATATSAVPALANSAADHRGASRAAAPRIAWTPAQLQALAEAYRAKNPGWRPPPSSGARNAAELTWTSENLDRLANAYAALNPGWVRPG